MLVPSGVDYLYHERDLRVRALHNGLTQSVDILDDDRILDESRRLLEHFGVLSADLDFFFERHEIRENPDYAAVDVAVADFFDIPVLAIRVRRRDQHQYRGQGNHGCHWSSAVCNRPSKALTFHLHFYYKAPDFLSG